MTAPTPPAPSESAAPSTGAEQMRGSSLLFVGKFLAIGANLAIQVLVVRYLSQTDYGAFAYALAIANFLTVAVGLGLEQAIQRFAAIYDEQQAYDRLAGAILLQFGLVAVLGTAVAVATWNAQGFLQGTVIDDQTAVTLLGVMVLLAPLQALDALIMNLFAVYAHPRAIFVRKYVLAPGLKLSAAVAVVLFSGDVLLLAWGYVLAVLAGILVYARVLVTTLRDRGVLRRGRRIAFPIKELAGYAFLAVASDLVVVLLFASDAVLVGLFEGSQGVALVQAIQPIANGNLLVFYALIPLFIPLMSRLFERGEPAAAEEVYRRSTLWTIVFTFPVLAMTASFGDVTAVTLFGQEYGPSGPILALFAIGQFVQAACGLSGLTLKVIARLKGLAILNIVIAILNIGVNVLLIPRIGALGAAIGTASSLIVLNIGRLLLLQRATGIRVMAPSLLRAGVSVVIAAGGLWLLAQNLDVPFVGAALLSVVAAIGIFLINRRNLEVLSVFPELGRNRVARAIVGAPKEEADARV